MTGLTFLIIFLILMAFLAIIPRFLQKLHIPTVISMVLIGIIMGPNMLNVIEKVNIFIGRGYPTDQIYLIIETFGLIGLIFLMSLAGLESKLSNINKALKPTILLSLSTFIVPALTGFFVYKIFRPNDFIGQLFYASLFASHSVGIVFPLLKELKVMKTKFGTAILSATMFTDTASLILVAICVQYSRHNSVITTKSISIFDKLNMSSLGNFFVPLFLLTVISYIVLSIVFIPIIGGKFFKKIHSQDDSRLTFFLITVLFVILLGEFIGVNLIVGAFIAGVGLSGVKTLHLDDKIFFKKIESAGYGFFIPFLFFSIGMQTDITVLLDSSDNIFIVLFTVLGLIFSKIFSGWIAMRIAGYSNTKGIIAGIITSPQLDATLAAAAVGITLGIIPANFFNSIVILAIVSGIIMPSILKIIIVKLKISFDDKNDLLDITDEDYNIEKL
jgi:Kef-type K+ transport system membrane component KefB